MFTGIVQAVGRVAELESAGETARVTIAAGTLDLADVVVGDSLSCNGVCLTVTQLAEGRFSVDVSQETLRVTAGFVKGAAVNLEKSLRLADRLGGHLVSGHVDGTGTVSVMKEVEGNREMTISFPRELARYFARKGSATVNGVSLTVNAVAVDAFTVNLIPHTLAVTNLGQLKKGSVVNLEVDIVARYVERMLGEGA
ncbi:MAG TPA: riboflavin synthase [Burkholderiales bacterium]|nr:riboflavin synthase [Burkholderiales bacterium]